MSRELQGFVLVALGAVVLRLTAGAEYLNYVKDSMRPWLLAAGAVLVILGVWTVAEALWPRRRTASEPVPEDGPGDGGDDHHGVPRAAWLLFVPIVALFVFAPPALGAFSAQRAAAVPALLDTSLPALPASDPVPLYLSDYVQRAVWDDGRTLAGRTVELTGFVLPQPDGGWLLARLQITCCAADAFASKVEPIGLPADANALPAEQWVTVTGRWVPGGEDGEVPLVEVVSVREIPQPENPYD